ncbi:DUF305 domain-containing protein [Streptomyces sp. NBC_01310]|uniref:DUF6153 family protein n=1 Tax=Streptomyces sp. NBC_01310 TaxID=2903820 RepID=UPI0035B588F4|nr:DUF305 domain-containing protein [Streptomyces sp. NBC_01310]
MCPDDAHNTGRHVSRTDAMCASASLPSAPDIAAPDNAPITGAEHEADAVAPAPNLLSAAYKALGKRAPPSLAELQLLRIQGLLLRCASRVRAVPVPSALDLWSQRNEQNAVKALAERIKKAQQPEIDAMAGWLRAWGERVPSGMDGMGHGNDDTTWPGMMDDEDLDRIGNAQGNAFALADDIITSQTAEITQMREMLKNG